MGNKSSQLDHEDDASVNIPLPHRLGSEWNAAAHWVPSRDLSIASKPDPVSKCQWKIGPPEVLPLPSQSRSNSRNTVHLSGDAVPGVAMSLAEAQAQIRAKMPPSPARASLYSRPQATTATAAPAPRTLSYEAPDVPGPVARSLMSRDQLQASSACIQEPDANKMSEAWSMHSRRLDHAIRHASPTSPVVTGTQPPGVQMAPSMAMPQDTPQPQTPASEGRKLDAPQGPACDSAKICVPTQMMFAGQSVPTPTVAYAAFGSGCGMPALGSSASVAAHPGVQAPGSYVAPPAPPGCATSALPVAAPPGMQAPGSYVAPPPMMLQALGSGTGSYVAPAAMIPLGTSFVPGPGTGPIVAPPPMMLPVPGPGTGPLVAPQAMMVPVPGAGAGAGSYVAPPPMTVPAPGAGAGSYVAPPPPPQMMTPAPGTARACRQQQELTWLNYVTPLGSSVQWDAAPQGSMEVVSLAPQPQFAYAAASPAQSARQIADLPAAPQRRIPSVSTFGSVGWEPSCWPEPGACVARGAHPVTPGPTSVNSVAAASSHMPAAQPDPDTFQVGLRVQYLARSNGVWYLGSVQATDTGICSVRLDCNGSTKFVTAADADSRLRAV